MDSTVGIRSWLDSDTM